jgi:predicted aspartyl protease
MQRFDSVSKNRLVWCAAALVMTSSACTATPYFDVRASIVNNLALVETKVNDGSPSLFLLDTGAGTSVIDKAMAERMGLSGGGPLDLSTGGGSVEASKLLKVELRIGENVRVSDSSAVALDLRSLSEGLGLPVGGILGYEVFRKYVVTIDYDDQRVTFQEPDNYQPKGDARVLPVHLEDGIPFIDVNVKSNGQATTARVEFDTGLTGALTLLRSYVDENRLLGPNQETLPIVTGALLPGKVPATLTRMERVDMGEFEMSNMLTNLAPDAQAAGLESGVGLVGGELLKRFDIAIDYSRRRILLSTSKERLQNPTEFDASGMSLAAQSDGFRTYHVRSVVVGSPADGAGILAGDVLAAVNEQPATAFSLADLRRLFREPDRDHVLEMTRNGVLRQVRIRTRRLV